LHYLWVKALGSASNQLMPTIMTHAVIPLGLAMAAGPSRLPARLTLIGVGLAMAPDLDVIGFNFGIQYAEAWGHRGATHSLIFALLVALLIWPMVRKLVGTSRRSMLIAISFLFASMASHGLLDALTDGGLGIALAWPWSDERFFFAWRPVEVSPLGVQRFFSARGAEVLGSELRWIVLPWLMFTASIFALRKVWGRR